MRAQMTPRDSGSGRGSGGLDQLALLDRIALGQRALLEHADRTAFAALIAHAARRLRLLRLRRLVLLGHGREPSQPGEAYLTQPPRARGYPYVTEVTLNDFLVDITPTR